MSDTGNNESGAPESESGSGAESGAGFEAALAGFDFDALGSEVLSEMSDLRLIKSKSGWTAIVLPLAVMPGERVEQTLGAMFSGGPVSFEKIRESLNLLKLAVVESSETDGGARLEDLGFGEWLELLEVWTNGG